METIHGIEKREQFIKFCRSGELDEILKQYDDFLLVYDSKEKMAQYGVINGLIGGQSNVINFFKDNLRIYSS